MLPKTWPLNAPSELFGCGFANVQPNSGSQANQGCFKRSCSPAIRSLACPGRGWHLTHGAKPNQSGKWFNAVQYGVRQQTTLDLITMSRSARQEHQAQNDHRRRLCHSRAASICRMREIADRLALICMSIWPTLPVWSRRRTPHPFPHAHVATTTTHKTLRGPRGGMILTNDEAMAKKFNSAIFPGIQGGPLMHVIAAKAVAFGEALRPSSKPTSSKSSRTPKPCRIS